MQFLLMQEKFSIIFYHILWISRIAASCLRGKRKTKEKRKKRKKKKEWKLIDQGRKKKIDMAIYSL